MQKRTTVRIVSFIAAIFLVAIGFIIKTCMEKNDLKIEAYNTYSRAFVGLTENAENVKFSLKKAMYTNDPNMLANYAGEIITESSAAVTNLSALPINKGSSAMLKFFTQTGDFSFYLAKKAASGKTISNTEKENLTALSEIASKVFNVLEDAEAEHNNFNFYKGLKNMDLTVDGLDDSGVIDLKAVLSENDDTLKGYPTLIYDGPYSDHLIDKTPVFLKDKNKISAEKAKSIAAKTLNIKESDLQNTTDEEGLMPCFRYNFNNGTISISKQGGYVVYFRKNTPENESKLSATQAIKKALEYLKNNYDYTFTDSYYSITGGVCTINCAYIDNNVTCYPDLIKVGVDLNTGEIVLIDSRAFLLNHQSRTLSAPKISEEEAKGKISSYLKIQSSKLAVIPSNEAENAEKYVYEFLTKNELSEDMLIYINCNTGDEEDILILLKTDGGTLTK